MTVRRLKRLALIGLMMGAAAQSAPASGDPELFARYFNAIPDICFQVARGHPPTNENAASMLLEPASAVPATVRSHLNGVTGWFRLKAAPDQVFIGIGDKPNACHVILANTAQTAEIQRKTLEMLKIGGFQAVQMQEDAVVTDALFVKQAPDGYMLISVQGPKAAVRGGDGDQGVVHVNLMPKAVFEALLQRH